MLGLSLRKHQSLAQSCESLSVPFLDACVGWIATESLLAASDSLISNGAYLYLLMTPRPIIPGLIQMIDVCITGICIPFAL